VRRPALPRIWEVWVVADVEVDPAGCTAPSELNLASSATVSPWKEGIGLVDVFTVEFVAKLVVFVEI